MHLLLQTVKRKYKTCEFIFKLDIIVCINLIIISNLTKLQANIMRDFRAEVKYLLQVEGFFEEYHIIILKY